MRKLINTVTWNYDNQTDIKVDCEKMSIVLAGRPIEIKCKRNDSFFLVLNKIACEFNRKASMGFQIAEVEIKSEMAMINIYQYEPAYDGDFP